MDARIATAARVAEIAPFHVMEVQTAARALEASGRSVVHMEIGEPDFPTPLPVIAAAQRAIAAGAHFLSNSDPAALVQHQFEPIPATEPAR